MKNHIVLIGMPASGKSTIGVMAAKFLGFDFIDTDILIQKTAGCTLPAIIKERGADGFLDFEGEIVRKTCPEAPTVIVQTALQTGRFCEAKRTRSGASGHINLMI